MRYCFEAVTTNAAKIMGLDGYGLEVGCNGDLVVLQAADPIEAIRLKARRLFVVRRGKVIAESARGGDAGSICRDGRARSMRRAMRRATSRHPGRAPREPVRARR